MPRYSLRTLMIVVTVVAVWFAVGSWAEKRKQSFRNLASEHDEAITDLLNDSAKQNRRVIHEYHMELSNKYRRAADRWWLPVEPDPPLPKN